MFLPPWLWRILRAKRTRTILVWSPFVAIASVALFYFGANGWGERVFRRTVDQLEARGFPRTLEQAIPELAVEDDFFAHPVVIAEMEESPAKTKLAEISALGLPGLKPGPLEEPSSNRHKGKLPDFRLLFVAPPPTGEEAALLTWQKLQPFEDRRRRLLDVRFSSAPLQLARVGQKPNRLGFTSSALSFFKDHTLSALHAGHPVEAAEDLHFMFSFAAAFQESIEGSMPGVISIGISAMPLDLVHEAARIGAFGEAQWTEIDTSISRLKPARIPGVALRFTTTTDIAWLSKRWNNRTSDREVPEWQIDWDGEGLGRYLGSLARHFRPQGFRDIDLARMLVVQADFSQPGGKSWRESVTREDLRRVESKQKEFERFASYSTSSFLDLPDPPEQVVWSNLKVIISKSLKLEAELALARHAIALERHRLRHGKHPPSLDTLDPDLREALPPDPMSGGTLHYRPEPSGGFTLWSVGLDGNDNTSGGDDLPWLRP